MQCVAIEIRIPRSFLQGRLIGVDAALEIPRTGQRIPPVIGRFRILETLQLLGGGGVILGLHLGMGTLAGILE